MKSRLLTLVALIALPGVSAACAVPVFRYALERWELTRYQLTVFYDKELPADVERWLITLGEDAPKANVSVVRIDVSAKLDAQQAKLWNRQGEKKSLPWISLHLPDAKLPDSWTGPCTVADLRRLIESPVRRTMVDQLAAGATAVFLLVPGVDVAANTKALELLKKELLALAQRVQLPEPSPDGPQILTGVPLKVEFQFLQVGRNEPAEAVLLETLVRSEPHLALEKGPIVFPVFGRGRVLCSVAGSDLTREHLANVVRFLCGECSCLIKEDNPGQDLLVAADWSDLLKKAGPATEKTVVRAPILTAPAAPTPTVTPPATDSANVAVAAPELPECALPPSASSTATTAGDSCGCIVSDFAQRYGLVTAFGVAGLLVLVTGYRAFLIRR